MQAKGEEPHLFVFDELMERLALRKDTIECQWPPYVDVPIRALLSELPVLDERQRAGRGEINIEPYHARDYLRVRDIKVAKGIAMGRGSRADVE